MLKLEHKMLSANQIASFFDQNYISWTNWGSFMIIYILMEKKRRPAKVCQNLYKIPRGCRSYCLMDYVFLDRA